MGIWHRNGRPRCRKEIFRRRTGRLRRMKGSAMLEAMAVILVFLVMASVLFASGRALNRQTVRTLEKNVARDGALTAVRLLAQDIMEGNRPGEEMEPEKTEGSGGGVTPSSAAAPVWRPVRYAPAEPLEE